MQGFTQGARTLNSVTPPQEATEPLLIHCKIRNSVTDLSADQPLLPFELEGANLARVFSIWGSQSPWAEARG